MNISGPCILRLSLLSSPGLSLLRTCSRAAVDRPHSRRALHDIAARGPRGPRRLSLPRRDHRRQAPHVQHLHPHQGPHRARQGIQQRRATALPTATTAMAYTIEDIQGSTIHPDGTIIPFTGKPYEKLIEKTQGIKYMAKVFTMPDVEVGSIIEYRYKLRYDDNSFISLRTGTFSPIFGPARATTFGNRSTSTATSFLPGERGQIKRLQSPGCLSSPTRHGSHPDSTSRTADQSLIELNVHDIPPAPEEEFMPPIGSFTYRVLFYYSAYRTVRRVLEERRQDSGQDSGQVHRTRPRRHCSRQGSRPPHRHARSEAAQTLRRCHEAREHPLSPASTPPKRRRRRASKRFTTPTTSGRASVAATTSSRSSSLPWPAPPA